MEESNLNPVESLHAPQRELTVVKVCGELLTGWSAANVEFFPGACERIGRWELMRNLSLQLRALPIPLRGVDAREDLKVLA